jgi:putative serine protease PepD
MPTSPMNIRRILAVAGIAVVCGGLAGLLVATIDDDDTAAPASVAPAPIARTVSSTPTPASIYSADAPGVVTVTDSTTAPANPLFPQAKQKAEQLGSGFVIDSDGHVVTNDHVIAGGSDIRIAFDSDHRYPAKVVGADPATDLAVLQVDAPKSQLHPLTFGRSSDLQPGDPAYAIGNPFALQRTMTAGIVSAVGRDIQAPDGRTIPNSIQTDTAINHGNSGGPLLNSSGQVIGVTSQIQGGTVDANVGVGFAVPSDTVESVAQQLIAHGHAEHAWLGVQAQDSAKGAIVAAVAKGSPAAKAGLAGKRRDVIVAIDGKPVGSAEDLASAIAAHKPGDKVTLRVERGSKARAVTVTLGDVPSGT